MILNLDLFKSIINQSKSDGRNITGLVNNAGERQRIKFNNIDKKLLNLLKLIFSIFETMKLFQII